MKYYVVVEFELDNAENVTEAAEMAAHSMMNETVNFEIQNADGEVLGNFDTEDFA